jgi:hypothetical protein
MVQEYRSSEIYPSRDKPIEPTYHQWLVLKALQRFLGFNGGTGAGKSWLGGLWSLEELRKFPTDDGMIVAPIFRMAKRRPRKVFEALLKREGIRKDIDYKYHQNDGIFEFATGAHVYLASADRPDTMEGDVLRWIWADEAGQMGKRTWDIMRRRTNYLKGRILMTSTPYSRNWFITDVVDRAEEGHPDYFAVTCRSIDNPHYDKSVYWEEKKLLPPDEFNRKYNAIAVARHGLVYKEFNEDIGVCKPIDLTSDWQFFAGIDWGTNHPFVFELFAYHEELDQVYNCLEYHTTGKELFQIAGELAPKLKDKEIIAYFDPSRPDSAMQLKRELESWGVTDIAFRKADNDRENGIMTVRKLLFQEKYKIFDTCKLNIEQKGLWSWIEEESGEYADKAEKKNDDSQDAERYALHTRLGKKREPKIYCLGAEDEDENNGGDDA